MDSKICLLFFGIALVNTGAGAAEYPLEFITQADASVHGMTYGFQLLEDIRQIRIVCEQRRDELEQHFITELQNWMKYSQQTQIMSRFFDDQQKEKVIKDTIANTYSEIYSSRKRRLNVIQSQCDESLEELLTQRKLSMLSLTTDFLSSDIDKLNRLVKELTSYEKQLQDGLMSCIATQAMQYESRLSSKVLQPEEYCSGPDINILTAFLNRMLDIIAQERALFFGDDEDLAVERPCGISGCEENTNPPPESQSPQILIADTEPAEKSYDSQQSSFEESLTTSPHKSKSSHVETPGTLSDKGNTSADSNDQTNSQSIPLGTSSHSTEPTASVETPGNSNTLPEVDSTPSEQNTSGNRIDQATTQSITTTPEPSFEPTASATITQSMNYPMTESNEGEHEIDHLQTQAATSNNEVTPQYPEWLDETVNEVFNLKKPNETLTIEPVSRDKHLHNSKKRPDEKESTSNNHRRPLDGEGTEFAAEATASGDGIQSTLIYSFVSIGSVLVVFAAVIGLAVVIVKYKRQQLVASKIQTQYQKIAFMKETGYINPTYKLENDW